MDKFTQNLHQKVGERWACALKKRYGNQGAKRIAADFNVEYRTAHGWLAGKPPFAVHFMRGWELFGIAFISETLNPRDEKSPAEIKQAFEEVRRRLEQLSDEIVLLVEKDEK